MSEWNKKWPYTCDCVACKKQRMATEKEKYKHNYEKLPPKVETPNVIEEALGLIFGDRQKAYGSPLEQYTKLAELWSALVGTKITAEQAVLMMIALKVVRAYDQLPDPDKEGLSKNEKEKHRDSIVDIAGYAGVIDKIEKERRWW